KAASERPANSLYFENPESRRLRIPPRAFPESSFLSRQKSFDALAIIRHHIPLFPPARLQPHPTRQTNFAEQTLDPSRSLQPILYNPSIPPLQLPQSISGFPANPLR
ncbi:hypothetical protein VDBG_04751, partial [Verticillium alfalfae VaMs.102]